MGRQALPTPLVPKSRGGEEVRPQGEPLGVMFERYVRESISARSANCQRNYRRTLDLSRGLGDHPTPADVERWLFGLLAADMAKSTVEFHRASLAAVYSHGCAMGWCTGNPARVCRKFIKGKPKPKAIPDIAERFPSYLDAMPDARARALICAMRYGGLREGEALGLKLPDLFENVTGRFCSITRQRPHGQWATIPPKGCKSRLVFVRRAWWASLTEEVRRPMTVRVGQGGGRRERSPFLFAYSASEMSLTTTDLRARFPEREPSLRDRLAAVDPEYFGPGNAWHVFRHSFALEFLKRGAGSVEQLQELLGHTDLKHTQGYVRALLGGATTNPGVLSRLDDEEEAQE